MTRTNADRAERAMVGLKAYAATDGLGAEVERGDLESALPDLLCDLLHLADEHKLPTFELLARARDHYDAERSGFDA